MTNIAGDAWLPTAVAIFLLASVAVVGLRMFGVASPMAPILALVRATLQLAILSVVLTGIIDNPWWVGLALAVMFVAAVTTAARRVHASATQWGALAASMATGSVVALVVVFATGAIEFSPRYVLAVGGIWIGNAMTIATLTSRVFTASVRDHWPEVEAWLSLGARPSQAVRSLARDAARTALIPSLDQTRTTGLVVLPGAFVGAIFGGASPLEAGRFQLVVLAGVLAAGTLTAVLLLRAIGEVSERPGPPDGGRHSEKARHTEAPAPGGGQSKGE